jgi:epoxyqueuosine reductase
MNATTIIPELVEAGLLLQGAIPVADLDDITAAAIEEAKVPLEPYRSLVLLGQAGTTFWDRHAKHHLAEPDPFDRSARKVVANWFDTHHPNASWMAVYPGDANVPLGTLAERLGWGLGSPIGLTIHPEYGLWVAHRFAFLTDIEFESTVVDPAKVAMDHPCSTCIDQPCVSACPVAAVSATNGFDVSVCAHHRISDGSDCRLQCLARNACPVGAEHRYSPAQMHHHYASGLESIIAWLTPDET